MRALRIVLATVLLVGCAHGANFEDAGSDGGRDSGIAPVNPRCEHACEMLTHCVAGRCEPFPSCTGDGRCVDGYVCQRRRCVPSDRDLDGDGFVAGIDCDESDPAVGPGREEDCNGADDDCDGTVDEQLAERTCSSACGGGTERCTSSMWTGCTAVSPSAEVCNGMDDDCNSRIDDGLVRGCSTACGSGTQTCVRGDWSGCTAAAPVAESCNGIDDDCNGATDDGLVRACSTLCGPGEERCSSGSWSACSARQPQAESCNLADDDCNGQCDEAGCRVGVHRSASTTRFEHFYTTSAAEAACCGFQVEAANYFYLYAQPAGGLVPFYRCLLPGNYHFYTADPGCEGAGASEGALGYIATSAAPCGSVPLFRLSYGADHLYTTSEAERNSALASGWGNEGIAGYVWTAPGG